MIVRALGLRNTLERAVGQYKNAVNTCAQMEKLEEHVPIKLQCSTQRDCARSYALEGIERCETFAQKAIALASTSNAPMDIAKAYLALGECYRLCFKDFVASIDSYTVAIELAKQHGHYDCYIWTSLCISDSLILCKEYSSARDVLEDLRQIIDLPPKTFELEKMHQELGLHSLDLIEHKVITADMQLLCDKYESKGVAWPRTYLNALLGGTVGPKEY